MARPSRPAPRSIQRFQVISVLGSGGMGTVYRALDPQLEREVAIKVLAHPAANATRTLSVHDTLDLKRTTRTSGVDLMSEARMMARLSHPNVLPVYEVGLADGALFVVMEHIEGCDLAAWLSVPHKLDDILRVLAQAGRGLAAAHSRGIVHRDFKPENVLVGNNGRVCVADFGLSQLVNGDPAGLAQLRITAGTPGYMAPELLRGEPATIASDVFAFATAVAEALGCPPGACGEDRDRRLRERGVSFRLRSAITAGLAVEPAARCSLDVLISSVEGRRWRWRWLAPATLLAALGGVIAIEATATPAASCELARSTWNLSRRTELVVKLTSEGAPASTVRRIVAIVDGKDRDITRVIDASCSARRAGQLTREQALIRQSCLARRRFELTSAVDRTLAGRSPSEDARVRMLAIADADACLTITPPPLPDDHQLVQGLYARFVASRDLRSEAGEAEVVAIEAAAERHGERELAARAALSLSRRYNARDELADAEAAAQRAYRIATEIHAVELAAAALVERSRVASQRGDSKSAASFAELARELTDRPRMSTRARARVYAALGRAHNDLGDYKTAIDELERGIALVEAMTERVLDVELPLRIMYVHSLATSRHDQHAVDVARETVQQVKQLVGDRDPNYAVALNMLAYALRCNSDLERALPIRRHALAVLLGSLPADDSHVMMQRADLADDLLTLGEFEQARLDYRRVLAASESNPTIKGNRVKVLPAYALATFHSGRIAEGLHLQEQAYEESLVQFGPDHPWTLAVLWTGIELALETRDIARAQRMLGVLHAGYRKRPEDALWAAVARGVLDADVAMLQRKPHVAENLAREALVRCGELNARDSQLVDVYFALGQSLRMQRKYSEAREALETAQRLAHKSQMRADAIAWIDVELATVDIGQGYYAEAYWRALNARAVLERFPGRLRARAQADAIISKARRS